MFSVSCTKSRNLRVAQFPFLQDTLDTQQLNTASAYTVQLAAAYTSDSAENDGCEEDDGGVDDHETLRLLRGHHP